MPRRSQYVHWWALALAILGLVVAGCNQGFGAFQTGVGNTPNKPPQAAFRVLGQLGLPFSALVSDATSSWQVRGAVPMNIIVVNNQTPVRVIVTKQAAGNGILSVQLTLGFAVIDVASTSDPFGTTSLQNTPTHPGFAPPPPLASPDVRLFVKGPMAERFSGMFEDKIDSNLISDRVPALFLYESPNGAVDATVTQIQNLGPFSVDLLLNGGVVAHASGGPTVTIRQP